MQVGDTYQIHEQTAKVLDNINRRLNEENKNLRNYRRALSFSQVCFDSYIMLILLYKTNRLTAMKVERGNLNDLILKVELSVGENFIF